MSQFVLDASAVLALLSRERGWEEVEQAIAVGAIISTVNIAEVVSKLNDAGMPETAIGQVLDLLHLEIVDFNQTLAHQTGMLRPHTKHMGLSLGDRACLALASVRNIPALTTDRAWEKVQLDIAVRLIR
jgi:PIN domain nuclease of toxin-antitoxin system